MNKRLTKSVLSLGAAMLIASGAAQTPVFAAEAPVRSNVTAIAGLNSNRTKFANDAALPAMKKTGFTEIDGKQYYLDDSGEKHTGALKTETDEYYFNENGEMVTGFVNEGDYTYYYNEDGTRRGGGLLEADGQTYVLDGNGKRMSGWADVDGTKYYLNEDGTAVKNETRTIDGNRYSFDQNGIMKTNVTEGGYAYGADGIGQADASAYERIAQAALAQLGVAQDCTMLVTNSLAAVGINFHGWPEEYLSLGPLTDTPVPGDICVYSGHVAIYIGNGQAVHGGWNGGTTAIFSVQCSAPFIGYVHPILP